MGGGFAGLAFGSLLAADGFFARHASAAGRSASSRTEPSKDPLAPRPSHFSGRAKSCIFLLMNGGPSQVDTFDHKPALEKYAGPAAPRGQKVHQLGRPPRRFPHALGAPLPPRWEKRPHDLGLFSKSAGARRPARGDPLLPRRQPRARLRPRRHEHGEHVDREAIARELVGLRPRHRKSESARLRRDPRQARRTDQRSAQLVERVHAVDVPGHALPAGRRSDPSTCAAPRASGLRRSASSSTCLRV
jgi:hypothetical protein